MDESETDSTKVEKGPLKRVLPFPQAFSDPETRAAGVVIWRNGDNPGPIGFRVDGSIGGRLAGRKPVGARDGRAWNASTVKLWTQAARCRRRYILGIASEGSEGVVMTDEDRLAGASEAAGSSRKVQHESGQSAGPARQPLATLLAEAGVASEEQLRLAVAEGMGRGERLGEVVLRRGWIDQPGLARLLARQWDLAHVDDEVAVPDPSAGALLSAQESERLAVCVIGFVDGVPLVAVAEPAEERFARVRSTLGRECVFAVVTKSTLERLLAQVVSAEAEARAAQASADAAEAAEDAEAERLLADLDAAATNLATWSERVSRIVDLQRQAENERSACREQLSALREQLTSERATVDGLEGELARQRELVSATRMKLADVARSLEAG